MTKVYYFWGDIELLLLCSYSQSFKFFEFAWSSRRAPEAEGMLLRRSDIFSLACCAIYPIIITMIMTKPFMYANNY